MSALDDMKKVIRQIEWEAREKVVIVPHEIYEESVEAVRVAGIKGVEVLSSRYVPEGKAYIFAKDAWEMRYDEW